MDSKGRRFVVFRKATRILNMHQFFTFFYGQKPLSKLVFFFSDRGVPLCFQIPVFCPKKAGFRMSYFRPFQCGIYKNPIYEIRVYA